VRIGSDAGEYARYLVNEEDVRGIHDVLESLGAGTGRNGKARV
jgi:hypothetical protein